MPPTSFHNSPSVAHKLLAIATLAVAGCAAPAEESDGSNSTSDALIDPGDNNLSYETPSSAVNGWGPYELNRSNGEAAAGDGHILSIGTKTYARGFGVHASSALTFDIKGACSSFTSDFGVDAEVGARGSVVFQVFADGAKLFDSGVVKGGTTARGLSVDVRGKRELKLVVTDGGDGNTYDHADWATPVLRGCTAPSASAPTAPAPPASVMYAAPLKITRGGTYTGNWQSLDPAVAAVTIATTEPVIIEKSNLRGKGVLVEASFTQANVTVRDTHGAGLNSGVAGRAKGRFLNAESFANVRVENCTLDDTAGIYFRAFVGNVAAGDTVKILRNRARNIDGRKSDGAGGYAITGQALVQFVQFNDVKDVPNVEVAWNEVANEPGKSAVEDNINVFVSRGTAASPFQIHDNLIDGAYAPDPVNQGYSGGGILLCDGESPILENACGYVEAFGNTVLNTTNYGIAVSAGHDNHFHDNRIFSTGKLPDGTAVKAQNVGMYIWNMHGDAASTYFANDGSRNVVGWFKASGSRSDWWLPDCAAGGCTSNVGAAGITSTATLDAERSSFAAKVAANGIVIGAR